MGMANLPNWISLGRLASVPVLLFLALLGEGTGFLVLLGAMLVSDVVDGFLARRLGVTSRLGAKLDSWGDLGMYISLPVGVWWLWPEIIIEEAQVLMLIGVSFALPLLVGLAKYRRLTSYHTWAAKAAAIAMGVAFIGLFGFRDPLLFHIAACLLFFESIEELMITATLPEWRSDVPTFLHARRIAERVAERRRQRRLPLNSLERRS